jgi:hypothetical protein
MRSTASPSDPTRREPTAPEVSTDDVGASPLLRWLLQYVVPLGGSLALHVALIAMLALTTWQVIDRQAEVGPRYDVGIVGSDTSEGGFDWDQQVLVDEAAEAGPTPGAVMDFSGLSDLADGVTGKGGARSGAESGGGFGIGEHETAMLLGIGGGATRSGDAGFGSGIGADSTIGSAGVWSLSARGNRFVYVVDFSGSIIVAVNDLRRELKRSIGNLRPTQSFNVIAFYGVGDQHSEQFRTESFAPTLQPATTRNKRSFFDWIDTKRPSGSTRPLPAIKRALTMGPEAVFFFSDGQFEDEVVDAIAAANQTRAKIHCLVFDELLLGDLSDLPRLTDGARRLQRIAEHTGGKSKVVTGVDLDE